MTLASSQHTSNSEPQSNLHSSPLIMLNGNTQIESVKATAEWQQSHTGLKAGLSYDLHTEECVDSVERLCFNAAKGNNHRLSIMSFSNLPAWTKAYYRRASTSSGGSSDWSRLFGSSSRAGSRMEVMHYKDSGNQATPRAGVAYDSDNSYKRPLQAHCEDKSNRYNSSLNSYNTDLSWTSEMRYRCDMAGHREKSSMLLEPGETEDEAKLMRRMMLIFTFGFLFPPIWGWGCLLSGPGSSAANSVSGERHITRKLQRWKMACAIMLGMSLVFVCLCIGVVYKL